MGNSLGELRLENLIRLLFFKHRGDVVRIIEDIKSKYDDEVESSLKDRISPAYVQKKIDKFKRQQKENSPFVAAWIMEYVFMGTKQRELLWHTNDEELEAYKFLYRSACCDRAAEQRTNTTTNEPFFVCLKCQRACEVYRIPNLDVFELQRKIRTEQRKDEEQLTTAVDALGFGGEKPPIIRQNNFNLIQGSDRKQIDSKDVGTVHDIKQLPPMDREVIASKLRRKLDDLDKEEIVEN